MARIKRGLSTFQNGGQGRRGPNRSYNSLAATNANEENPGHFTLADEARQTQKYDHSSWDVRRLRTLPISFVSGGTIDPNIPAENSGLNDPPQLSKSSPQSCIKSEDNHFNHQDQAGSPPSTVSGISASQGFFFDVKRNGVRQPVDPIIVPSLERQSSPDHDSGSEILLFQGRNRTQRQMQHDTLSLTTMHTELCVLEDQLEINREKIDNAVSAGDSFLDVGTRRRHRRRGLKSQNEEDVAFADYIENLQNNGELLTPLDVSSGHSGQPSQPKEKNRKEISVSSDSDEEVTKATDSKTARHHNSAHREFKIHRANQTNASLAVPIDESEVDELFDEFDLMDWEQPSLRKKRGKKGSQPVMQLNDLELEQMLQTAWKNDRFKKAQRKKMREELRAAGQLGKRPQSADPRSKYPAGMSLSQVAEEIRGFLLKQDESLALPPMDKHARKIIHDLASKFNIKSKSVGQGEQRRPTLHRTNRTSEFNEQIFDNIVMRVNRKFFPRLDAKFRRRRDGATRGGDSAANVRDGEIVGGAAPELGIDNRGRTMLEKMGWSSGTALGAGDNKGILQPVTHTVKRSKSGLG